MIRSLLVRPYAHYIRRFYTEMGYDTVERQDRVLSELIKDGQHSAFGRDHKLKRVKSYEDFKKAVPVRDYEDLKPYIERVKEGERDVLWPGRPAYFAKTSGTTSGVKYIPITRTSLPGHFGTARDAAFNYAARTGNYRWLDGKMIFLSGSPELEKVSGIPTGRLSGISNHLVPAWLRTNQLPGWETNCIEDWEEKLDRIVDETINQDMRMISGIPPWVQMYFERLIERSGKSTIKEIFPNFSLFVYGGVNYNPYKQKLDELIGGEVDTLETYPASEGFIAFQDLFPHSGLRMNVDAGMFFEFIPINEVHRPNPERVSIRDVEIGVNYAIVLNTTAGLWGYNLGDTVRFVSLSPHRVEVTGRVKHFISAFGEHVIAQEVEVAMQYATSCTGINVTEFTVAPQVNPPEGGLPYHEWFIEFEQTPENFDELIENIELKMRLQNIYYDDLIRGNILRPMKVTPLRRDAFRDYMKSIGKLGGQNKVPHLSNTREVADALQAYKL
ncbi:MAG: GH3 auxin-responsive promoter family protein [Saprospiraceae bacterium]|nr:GH3 auxin-responsive promoter family protein [Saprospiraceae bacterium]